MTEYRVRYIHEDGDRRALDAFRSWMLLGRPALAVDTETTGLNVWGPGFRCRLVVLADAEQAWVLNVESGGADVRTAVREALMLAERIVMHNATFDQQVLERAGLAEMEELQGRTVDTRLLAHLADPRGRQDGGVGHGLKALAVEYVDAGAADGEAELLDVFRRLNLSKADGYARVPVDDPVLVKYAGMDGILTARLLPILSGLVERHGMTHLITFEHRVQALLARLERRGMRLDVAYAERLAERYVEREAQHEAAADMLGVGNVNSTRQVAAAMQQLGATLTVTTPSGALKVDKNVLADVITECEGAPAELAREVLGAKHAAKYRKSYVEACLGLRDSRDRVHPRIAGLAARTARMSVSTPPLQQLPSDDWWVRRMFVAEPGELIGAADYSQVELRVLGALAQEKNIIQAVADGVDLHDLTAERVGIERRTAKMVNFLTVYGGGATALSRQAHISKHEAKAALAGYHRSFPGVKRWGRQLMERAEYGRKEVRTVSGRRLPLDRDRLYAATNYQVQSAARDVLAESLLSLEEAGLERYLLIPVHDEVVFSAPEDEAAEVAAAIGGVMSMDFLGVWLEAEGEVYGPSWGHGYGDCVEPA